MWILMLCCACLVAFPILLAIAFLTLAERKVMGSMQRRVGPNKVGIFGLIQPFADGIKLLCKETILPSQGNKLLFLIAPIIIFSMNLLTWAPIPFIRAYQISDMHLGIIYILAISSIGVVGIILAGWSGNSKYSLMGCLRTSAQLISYELIFGLIILTITIILSSFNINEIILFQQSIYFIIPLFPLFIVMFISALAETNRPPFDLVESESELVSGAFTEYSSFSFALIFLGEYGAMITMSSLISILFFGGYLLPTFLPNFLQYFIFGLKICFCLFIFIWVRSTLPRVKFNQLISLCWKSLFPLILGLFIFVVSILTLFTWATG